MQKDTNQQRTDILNKYRSALMINNAPVRFTDTLSPYSVQQVEEALIETIESMFTDGNWDDALIPDLRSLFAELPSFVDRAYGETIIELFARGNRDKDLLTEGERIRLGAFSQKRLIDIELAGERFDDFIVSKKKSLQ